MQPQLSKPLLVYDNECEFCRYWVAQWQHITGVRVEYVPYQEVAAQFPEISLSTFQSSVQYISENGDIYPGAEAVFRALNNRVLLWCYDKLIVFKVLSESIYRFIAGNRWFFSTLTRWLWGTHSERTSNVFSRWLFLRGLGCIYLIAFVSLWVQIHGLIGSNGILPVENYLTAVYQQLGVKGYHIVPTLLWLNSTDLFLNLICAGGVVLSIVLIAGFIPTITLIGLWVLYLSLVTTGQVFLSFQWDVLLLETGFLAIFLSPFIIRDRTSRAAYISLPILLLLRWLLFRLMFASGYVKLASDEVWRNLTALNVHYETQPLPTWIGWYVHQFPEFIHKLSVIGMFAVELVVPFLIFAPRRLRNVGCIGLLGLQMLILLTGNYCFFNLLTIVLCLLLIDDITWKSLIPKRIMPQLKTVYNSPGLFGRICLASVAILIMLFTSVRFIGQLFPQTAFSEIARKKPLQWVTPLHIANTYGLFADMTESRPEIVVEGSNDGITWESYDFKWKPGRLDRAPGWVAPHQPRLDWQMWFAALRGNFRNTSWFIDFMGSLLHGKPEVLRLLAENPFPDTPPRYLRALLYDYQFTDIQTKRTEGTWWQREYLGIYCPVISLR